MFTNNGGASMADKTSSKRKMKDMADEQPSDRNLMINNNNNNSNLFNRQSQQQFASPNVQRVQQILNSTAGAGHFRPSASTLKPFSYMSLLTAPDEELLDICHSYQIDQIITHHSDNLKHVLATMLNDYRQVTEERAAKKLKAKEEEMKANLNRTAHLEQMLEHYKEEAERLSIRVRSLERTTSSLRASLEIANAALAESEQENTELSFESPNGISPVMLDCKVCQRQLATVMIRPCRHVCVCKRCEITTRVCPVCRSLKTTSVEVRLPLD